MNQKSTNTGKSGEVEEKSNNTYSFIVGIFIALAIIILFVIFFR